MLIVIDRHLLNSEMLPRRFIESSFKIYHYPSISSFILSYTTLIPQHINSDCLQSLQKSSSDTLITLFNKYLSTAIGHKILSSNNTLPTLAIAVLDLDIDYQFESLTLLIISSTKRHTTSTTITSYNFFTAEEQQHKSSRILASQKK